MALMRVKLPNTGQSGWAKSFAGVKGAMMSDSVYRMNATALRSVASVLNAVPAGAQGLHVPDLYTWLQRLMTMATAEGLYGRANPLRKKPELLHNIW